MSVDPLADEMPGWSPYSYTFNNPIRYTDPDGRIPVPVVGFIIGFGLDVATQMIFEGKSLSEVNYLNATISGASGMASGGLANIKNFSKAAKIVSSVAIDASESVAKQVVSGNEISGEQLLSDVVLSGVGNQAKVFDDASIKIKDKALDRAERIVEKRIDAGKTVSSGRVQNVKDAKSSVNFANRANDAAGTGVSNVLQTGSDNIRSFLSPSNETGIYINPNVQMAQDNTRVVLPVIDRNQ